MKTDAFPEVKYPFPALKFPRLSQNPDIFVPPKVHLNQRLDHVQRHGHPGRGRRLDDLDRTLADVVVAVSNPAFGFSAPVESKICELASVGGAKFG